MTSSILRRSVLKLGLVGAAGLAMPQIMVRAAAADIPKAGTATPGFSRFMLGDFEITTILDGTNPLPEPHTVFGTDQKPEEVAALLTTDHLPTDQLLNSYTPALVNTGSELVLFDTGRGEGGGGQLRERLQASGYKPEDVTVVVITHMHGDHIGGLMEEGNPAFPNARYVFGQTEYDFWTAPERMSGPTESSAKLVEAKVKPLAEKASFIGDGGEVTSGITGMMAAGHTPGHMIFMLESGGRSLALTADTANHYILSLRRPDWHVKFDADKDAAATTRTKVFDMIAADKIPFIGYHMPFPAVGFVEKVETGYRYIPETYQLDL